MGQERRGIEAFGLNHRLMQDRGIALPVLASGNDAEVWVGVTRVLGVIYLRDEIRPAAKGVIDFLKRSGVSVTLLTGDRPGPATLIANEVGIDDVRPEMTPQAKLQCIHDWRAAGKKVVMVGDGINDAPSLIAADVSIGMGARGSDAALEQADVILMHDKIENVEEAFRLSHRARTVIRQNIAVQRYFITHRFGAGGANQSHRRRHRSRRQHRSSDPKRSAVTRDPPGSSVGRFPPIGG